MVDIGQEVTIPEGKGRVIAITTKVPLNDGKMYEFDSPRCVIQLNTGDLIYISVSDLKNIISVIK